MEEYSVEEIKKDFENQIITQFSNSNNSIYKDKLDAIIQAIEEDNFNFIEGDNLEDRVCGKIVEDVVAVLYNLQHTNQYSNDFIIGGKVYEFKTAFNGWFVVKFYFKNNEENANNVVFYQDNDYLVANVMVDDNNNCDFTSIKVYIFTKLQIENEVQKYRTTLHIQ
jgi:Ni,Fe-hydrogenase III component G